MPCLQNVKRHTNVTWRRITDGKGVGATIDCGSTLILTAKDSGKYTCLTCNLSLSLQVVEKSSQSCLSMEETSKYLVVGAGGEIPCPGLTCGDNTSTIWYKDDEVVPDTANRDSCEKNGWLHLCTVYKEDTGVYFCDRTVSEGGTEWIFRTAVTVFAVAHLKPTYRPRILNPSDNTTKEVELGGSFTLTCEVFFPIEIPLEKFSPEVRWHMNYEEKSIPLHLEKKEVGPDWTLTFRENMIPESVNVTQRAIIQKVTPQHLNSTYTCSASNAVGNSSVTMSLRKKTKVVWPSLVGYPVVSLLLVAGLGIFVHVKWLELQLIYKCHFPKGNQSGDNKQYDVMLSYVWSPPATELKVWMLSSSSGPGTEEKDPQNSEEGTTTQTQLAVRLPQVLEGQWRHRLWLPERDLLPGGAYMDDVVLAIQKSRMLICVLSADYLSNSKAVFVLESGIQALLQNSTLKLLLIWTNRASVPLNHLNASLPMLVQRALKVLPSLDWPSGGATTATNHFWKSLRKAMPPHTQEDNFIHVRPVRTEC
ncbi:uncharacterized protein V6R79_000499 [Siganus canaliculatus]